MYGYLGETAVNVKDTEFKNYTPADWALYFIQKYSGIDGTHHKDWVLDQVARILTGSEIIIKEAKWENGQKEYRVILHKPSRKYKDWVAEITKDGEYTYELGIAP